jgi:hypothetical protein
MRLSVQTVKRPHSAKGVVLVSATDKRQREYCCQAQPVSNSLAVTQSKHGAGETYNRKITLTSNKKATEAAFFVARCALILSWHHPFRVSAQLCLRRR